MVKKVSEHKKNYPKSKQCPLCLSYNTYVLEDGTIVCRKCGERTKASEESNK